MVPNATLVEALRAATQSVCIHLERCVLVSWLAADLNSTRQSDGETGHDLAPPGVLGPRCPFAARLLAFARQRQNTAIESQLNGGGIDAGQVYVQFKSSVLLTLT